MTEVAADRHVRLREEFVARRGYWNDEWEFILGHAPDYFEAYMYLSSYASEQGTVDAKTRELIYIATCATVTHLFEPGLRQHARNAIELGATAEEIMAVLALVSLVGVQTYYLGVAALEDVQPGSTRGLAEHVTDGPMSTSVAEQHRRLYGDLSPEAQLAIDADPSFYSRFLDLAAVALEPGVLSAKTAHLILVAVYACATGLWAPGVKQHIRAALAHGATPAEIMAVCEQITGMSVHTLSVGVPALFAELASRGPVAPTASIEAY